MLSILFYIFIGLLALQIFFYLIPIGAFSFSKNVQKPSPQVPISVIVCAKNEAENIRKNLPLLIAQDYPKFEIVLIDDASIDDTLDVFERYEKEFKNIKVVKVANNEAFWGNKKFAMTLGIKAASYEYLVFIAPNSRPSSKFWLSEMGANFSTQKTIVLGYGALEKVKHSFVNKIIRFDAFLNASHYFGWAILGKPYTGNGRNLAYKKAEFFKVRGYNDHMKIRSGEDVLFVNQAANASNTQVSFSKNSFTYTEPKKTFKDWFAQKKRQVALTKHFKIFDRFQIAFFFISNLFFYGLAISLLLLHSEWQIIALIIVARFILLWGILGFAARKLNEKDVVIWYPLLEIFHITIVLNIIISNIFSKPIHWK
jgi:glycosyltransferase involved in cell wall biosynthesis